MVWLKLNNLEINFIDKNDKFFCVGNINFVFIISDFFWDVNILLIRGLFDVYDNLKCLFLFSFWFIKV